MYIPVRGVALRTVRYSDRAVIVTLWTAEEGMMAVSLSATSGRESRRRRALTMPMTLVEAVLDVRPGREIANVREITAAAVCPDITANPVKSAVAMFMAEVLGNVLREAGGRDEALWTFLRAAVERLDRADRATVANFPLWFLARFAVVSGIEPDTDSWRPGSFLDLREGIFRVSIPAHRDYLDAAASRLVRAVLVLDAPRLGRLRLGGYRPALLDGILDYYARHNLPAGTLRSLPVLREMMR